MPRELNVPKIFYYKPGEYFTTSHSCRIMQGKITQPEARNLPARRGNCPGYPVPSDAGTGATGRARWDPARTRPGVPGYHDMRLSRENRARHFVY